MKKNSKSQGNEKVTKLSGEQLSNVTGGSRLGALAFGPAEVEVMGSEGGTGGGLL